VADQINGTGMTIAQFGRVDRVPMVPGTLAARATDWPHLPTPPGLVQCGRKTHHLRLAARTCGDRESAVAANSRENPEQGNPMKRSHGPRGSTRLDCAAPDIPDGEALGDERTLLGSRRAFSILAFTMNRFIVDHVVRSARLFDNDAEAMMLFGMLAHSNVGHRGTR
jgi:hypothetical protein